MIATVLAVYTHIGKAFDTEGAIEAATVWSTGVVGGAMTLGYLAVVHLAANSHCADRPIGLQWKKNELNSEEVKKGARSLWRGWFGLASRGN